jgi:hypothetical protein
MKTVSHEMKAKKVFFETISCVMKSVTHEMKSKKVFLETFSQEMKSVSCEMKKISFMFFLKNHAKTKNTTAGTIFSATMGVYYTASFFISGMSNK